MVTMAMASASSASTSSQQLKGFVGALVHIPVRVVATKTASRLRRSSPRLFSWKSVNVVSFKSPDRDLKKNGFCCPSSSVASQIRTAAVRPQLLKGQRQRMIFRTSALPADTYWITLFQAVGVSVFMALAAVISGIAINIGIEIKAVQEFVELEKKGEFKEEDYQLVPDEDFGSFESGEAVYILSKELTGNRPARNRPVRELQEAELQEVPSDQ